MYSFMNYGGFAGGTWYPQGGMIKIALAMEKLSKAFGVEIHTESAVTSIEVRHGKAESITVNGEKRQTDGIVASADYSHVDQMLLPPESRRYSPHYWDKRVLAPSSYILYLGLSSRVERLLHHTLFFDADFARHSKDLTSAPRWPEDPLFYVSRPSKTDPSVAPAGSENLFILVPLAAGLPDTPELRSALREKVLTRLERFTGCDIRRTIVFERGYCISDFKADYNALKGNAYGLANTLRQTAVGKPQMISSKVHNLVYAGQLTVPGPGLPPSLISGQIAAKELIRLMKR
jgi:phytoene desaturase